MFLALFCCHCDGNLLLLGKSWHKEYYYYINFKSSFFKIRCNEILTFYLTLYFSQTGKKCGLYYNTQGENKSFWNTSTIWEILDSSYLVKPASWKLKEQTIACSWNNRYEHFWKIYARSNTFTYKKYLFKLNCFLQKSVD